MRILRTVILNFFYSFSLNLSPTHFQKTIFLLLMIGNFPTLSSVVKRERNFAKRQGVIFTVNRDFDFPNKLLDCLQFHFKTEFSVFGFPFTTLDSLIKEKSGKCDIFLSIFLLIELHLILNNNN